jgi:hypothetical protein
MVRTDFHGLKDPHGIIEQAEFGVQGKEIRELLTSAMAFHPLCTRIL